MSAANDSVLHLITRPLSASSPADSRSCSSAAHPTPAAHTPPSARTPDPAPASGSTSRYSPHHRARHGASLRPDIRADKRLLQLRRTPQIRLPDPRQIPDETVDRTIARIHILAERTDPLEVLIQQHRTDLNRLHLIPIVRTASPRNTFQDQ